MIAFGGEWLVEDSIEKTVKNLISCVCGPYVRKVSIRELCDALILELKYMGAYNEKDMKRAGKYIRDHAYELYEFAKQSV